VEVSTSSMDIKGCLLHHHIYNEKEVAVEKRVVPEFHFGLTEDPASPMFYRWFSYSGDIKFEQDSKTISLSNLVLHEIKNNVFYRTPVPNAVLHFISNTELQVY
jgi:hypothetical protein